MIRNAERRFFPVLGLLASFVLAGLFLGRVRNAQLFSRLRSSDAGGSDASAPVRFEFHQPTARRVFVAGSFNGWNPSATPLAGRGGGRWLRLLWLPPGRHEYLFVADGIWRFDPSAADYVPNVYGTMNAVVEVLAPSETVKRGCDRRLLRSGKGNAGDGGSR